MDKDSVANHGQSQTAASMLDKIRAKAYHGHPDHPVTEADVDWLLSEIDRLQSEADAHQAAKSLFHRLRAVQMRKGVTNGQ